MALLDLQNKLSTYINDKLRNTFLDHSIINFTKNTTNPGLESSVYFFTIEFTDLKNKKIQKNLVLKIYDGIISQALFDPDESAKIEFHVLNYLSTNNIPIPTPYAYESSSNSYFNYSFVIMDFIRGIPFLIFIKDLQIEGKNDEIEESWQNLIRFMNNIENLDISPIRYLFPDAVKEQDHYHYLFHDLEIWKQILNSKKVEINKFEELFNWLKTNKVSISRYSLINRDYKPSNFIVSNGKPILLDWSKCYITDFRLSLGYMLMLLSLNPDRIMTKERFFELYKGIVLKNVPNIDYFIILALLKDLSIGYMLSLYIKTDDERKEILMDYRNSYSLLKNLTKEEFPILEAVFKFKKIE